MKQITSLQNPEFKSWLKLLASKGIKQQGQFFVFGAKAARDTLQNFPHLCTDLLLSENQTLPPGANALRTTSLSEALYKELDVFGTKHPILVCQTPEIATWNPAAPQGLEIACALSDPSNLGALLRSAVAFGVTQVILLKECASPFHPKAVRAASGATLMSKLVHGPSIEELIGGAGYFGLDMNGTHLPQFHWPKSARLILGEEGRGLPKQIQMQRLTIPMQGQIESLNATIAASLAMYSFAQRGTTTHCVKQE